MDFARVEHSYNITFNTCLNYTQLFIIYIYIYIYIEREREREREKPIPKFLRAKLIRSNATLAQLNELHELLIFSTRE